MKYILILIFLFAFRCTLFSQDSADIYISRLGWESIFIKTTYSSQLVMNKESERLIGLKDKKIILKLFNEIENPNKTVIIHSILSRTFGIDNFAVSHQVLYEKDSVAVVKYQFNNLRWYFDIAKNRFRIDDCEIQAIKSYWKQELLRIGKLSFRYP